MKTLARFIQEKREENGFTQKGLAIAANIPFRNCRRGLNQAKELFLPVTIRQALAKVLKCEPSEIKKFEKDISGYIVSPEIIESLKRTDFKWGRRFKMP